MCTVTWCRRSDGYDLLFNRDERRARPEAEPPREHTLSDTRALYPTDPQGGGTWMGVNEFGLTLCLLNYYSAEKLYQPEDPVSRGLLVPALLDAATVSEAVSRLAAMNLEPYPPFIMLGIAPGEAVTAVTWNGSGPTSAVVDDPPILTTSSHEEGRVVAFRREQFHRWFTQGWTLTPEHLLAFHRSQEPEPGPFAVCMERDDAATQSLSHVEVKASSIAFIYSAGPPSIVSPNPPSHLARTQPPGPSADAS